MDLELLITTISRLASRFTRELTNERIRPTSTGYMMTGDCKISYDKFMLSWLFVCFDQIVWTLFPPPPAA